jgi:hypothetical protein
MSESDFVLDIVKRLAPDATDQQAKNAADRARDKCMASGGGIAQLFTDSRVAAERVIREAISETFVKAKLKGETDLAGPEVAKLESERLCFGKAGALTPMKFRGEHVKKYGQAEFDSAMARWRASATNLAPHSNPYTKAVKKQMREARNGTLDSTPHNDIFHADEIKAPKPPKRPKVEGGVMSMTELGRLYKSDPEAARAIAAKSGLKI